MFNLIIFSLLFINTFVPSLGVNPWEPESEDTFEHQQFVYNSQQKGKAIQIVFYGDSMVGNWTSVYGRYIWEHNYAPLHAVNYAISGDRTQHIIWRIEDGEVTGLNPKVIVLNIGTNNLGQGYNDAEIVKGIKAILDLIRLKLPQTKILILGLFPREDSNGAYIPHINKINNLLANYADGKIIHLLVMNKHYQQSTGHLIYNLFLADKIHLSEKGYELWAQTMDPILKPILGMVPKVPKAWEPEDRNIPLHQQFLAETNAHAKDIKIVFYGDSITQGWSGNGKKIWDSHYATIHAVNYGIRGDRTQHIIWRIENGEINGLSPKVIVLMIGINNIGHDSDEDIAAGIKRILDILHEKLPHTKVLLLGVLPAPTLMAHTKGINSIIEKYDNGNSVRFLDMGPHFEDSAGKIKENLFVMDYVHLSEKGYEVWYNAMDKLFLQMLI